MVRSLSFPYCVLLLATLALAGCRSDGERARSRAALPQNYVTLLGSAEGWGLIGLPRAGGALTYRHALDLAAPTWAPPEMGAVAGAQQARGAVWVEFDDGGLGFYEYRTGHFRTFDEVTEGTVAAALSGRRALLVAPDSGSLSIVGRRPHWSVDLDGKLIRLLSAREESFVAVVEKEGSTELVVIGAAAELGARLDVGGLVDIVVTGWGNELYYLPADDPSKLIGLTLPELEPTAEIELPEPGELIAATPSTHRLYVAAATRLFALDRSNGRQLGVTELPGLARELRFGQTGADLLIRLDGDGLFAVLRVGVDSILGVISGSWDRDLPISTPGGRLISRIDGQLVLYELPSLIELTRVDEDHRFWLAVGWQPPQPREWSQGRPAPASADTADAEAGEVASAAAQQPLEPVDGVRPGYYVVVLAARSEGGVDKLVKRLRSLGYPGLMDHHRDALGVKWFRAMMGPYASRSRAETAARELGARYGYKPWILTVDETSAPSAADSLALPLED